MNDLSWYIILADVLPHVATAICIASFIGFFFFGALYFLGLTDFFGGAAIDASLRDIAARFRRFRILLPLFLILWVLSFVVPTDKNTYYAIAASEVGERIMKTPTAGKAMKALDHWLDNQLIDHPADDGNSSK